MTLKNIVRILFATGMFCWLPTQAMNLLTPYSVLIRPPFRLDSTRFHLDFYAEHGFDATGFDSCGAIVPITQIRFADQNALAMLDGFDPNTAIGQLAANLRADAAVDDGVRGRYKVCGNLDFNGFSFDGRVKFLDNFFLTAYLPFYTMQLKNTCWQNQTQNITSGDVSIRQKLTDNFFANVCELGGLYLGDWKRTGLGDFILMLEWVRDFPQAKPFLRNAQVNWRIGTSLPSGLRQDEDKILAPSFGGDGAVGLLFGLQLKLTLGSYLNVGGNVDLLHLFGNSKLRRIKTFDGQTDLLLLQKAFAYKDFGLTQRFDLYTEFMSLRGFNLKVGYQYFKHGDDILALDCQEFSDFIANTSENLFDKTLHQVIVNASYDFAYLLDPCTAIKPYISFFTRLPVIGQRTIACPTFGGVIAFDF